MCVDIDDTLIMRDLSTYPKARQVVLNAYGHDVTVAVNQKMVNSVIYYSKLGWKLVFWSRTGEEWARAVVEALELEEHCTATMTKPLYYLDDKNWNEWSERLWRSPL